MGGGVGVATPSLGEGLGAGRADRKSEGDSASEIRRSPRMAPEHRWQMEGFALDERGDRWSLPRDSHAEGSRFLSLCGVVLRKLRACCLV